ncbi:bola protein [Apodospora peruviana]|uniref:Bola protein n=1 Tax=Apodospora peruviana TaxID=516989 RepID=A0AAE0M9N8_9PEZI|nr:bola protein [Apodospora peruviana]
MICRACLRAGLSAEASLPSRTTVFSQRTRQSAIRTQSLSSSTTTLRFRPLTGSRPILQTPSLQARLLPSSRRTMSTPVAESPVTTSPAPEKPDFLSEGESQVWDLLMSEFSPTELVVQDISGGCGSMYGIEIGSEKFRGLNMLKQQRLVNAALGDLMKEWHGVQLKTRVP